MFIPNSKQKASVIAQRWRKDEYFKYAIERISTGFPALDNALGGGLIYGLHIMGAIPTLGKSTFLIQMIDQMAMKGHYCIHFALEVSEQIILAKSLARQMYCDYKDKNPIKTATELMDINRMKQFTEEEWAAINYSREKVEKYGEHIWIVSQDSECRTAQDIVNYTEKWMDQMKKRPIIFIDYLQLLDSSTGKLLNDKQRVDESVRTLQRFALKKKIPIVLISSLNRESYEEEINTRCFKESGGIEFGAETLIGLQIKGTGEKGFKVKEGLARNPRQIGLSILKSKNSRLPDRSIEYLFYPENCYFEEKNGMSNIYCDNYRSGNNLKRNISDFS